VGPLDANVTAMSDHVSAVQNDSTAGGFFLQESLDSLFSRLTTNRTPWCMGARKNMMRKRTHSTRL
jgi:hypothetical protein